MKVGLIRCMQTENMCPGTTDFKVMKEKKCAFEGIEEEIEVIGVNTCGGCPGKKAVTRASEMVKRGADTIALLVDCRQSVELVLLCRNNRLCIGRGCPKVHRTAKNEGVILFEANIQG